MTPNRDPVRQASDAEDRNPQVDALRQRLRSLGYLDAPVDRFVLGPAHGNRGAAAIAILASLRIGVLGALLLGPAAALGVASGLPGLVTGVRDRVVVALYLALLFGAAITTAALATSLLAWLAARWTGGALARVARPLSVAAGVVVGAACLVYLTLLSAALHSAAPPGSASLWTAVALAVSVAISLLLGHAVMLSTLALVVAGTGTPITGRGVPGASWRVMLAAGVVAFAGALAVSNVGYRPGSSAAPRPHLTVVPSGIRLRVVAIDGFDPVVFEALARAGRVPTLARLFQSSGARLTLQDVNEPAPTQLDPARLWTTIATAQPASVHGVQTLETRRIAGVEGTLPTGEGSVVGGLFKAATDLLRLTRPAVASGSQRREKTFWEVAADAGLRTSVVNWWATWPASSDSGIVLSDRAALRLERGGALDGEISPSSVYDRLTPEWPALHARAESLAAQALAAAPLASELVGILQRSAAIDALTLVLAAAVADETTDLGVVYLPGLDIAQHALVGGAGSGVQSPSAVAARLTALESYYVVLDTLLMRVASPGQDEVVMAITAPGRVAPQAGGRLMIGGARIRHGAAMEARATDVAPTILYALGLPISDGLAGTPLVSLFEESFVQKYPVRHVTGYGPREAQQAARTGQPLDQEMVDRLRSLGYVR